MRTKNEMINKMLGEVIREARLRKGYSMQDVADRISSESNRARICKYENGSRTMPIDVFIKICTFLEIDYKKVLADVAKKI